MPCVSLLERMHLLTYILVSLTIHTRHVHPNTSAGIHMAAPTIIANSLDTGSAIDNSRHRVNYRRTNFTCSQSMFTNSFWAEIWCREKLHV